MPFGVLMTEAGTRSLGESSEGWSTKLLEKYGWEADIREPGFWISGFWRNAFLDSGIRGQCGEETLGKPNPENLDSCGVGIGDCC